MLKLPHSVRVFVCMEPTDMRRSFDGLAGLVGHKINEDPLSGHLFVFRNRRADRLKILWWDRDGYAIFYKRLEQGTFRLPEPNGEGKMLLTSTQLVLLLEGVDLVQTHQQKRFCLEKHLTS